MEPGVVRRGESGAAVDRNGEIGFEVRLAVRFALNLDLPVSRRSRGKERGGLICGHLELNGDIAASQGGELVTGEGERFLIEFKATRVARFWPVPVVTYFS